MKNLFFCNYVAYTRINYLQFYRDLLLLARDILKNKYLIFSVAYTATI